MAPVYDAAIDVMLKPLVNDPQGLAVRDGLHELGFEGVRRVRVGKHITVQLDAATEETARAAVEEMCHKLLANGVIETFAFSIAPAEAPVGA